MRPGLPLQVSQKPVYFFSGNRYFERSFAVENGALRALPI
jgi:hypothetical protein